MSTKHVQPGFAITVVLAAAAVTNQLIKIGDLVGVCLGSGAIGDSIEAAIDEVFDVAKLSTDDVGQGAQLYLDEANKWLTLDANGGANIAAAKAVAASGVGAATVQAKLNA